MEIEFLGTGTSTGVPQIGCDCEVCKSDDARDNRLRTSAIVREAGVNILIDCGPDFRQQILRCKNKKLDALLLTHIHFDHVGGVEDLRPYCLSREFNIYAQSRVISGLKERLPYCLVRRIYPGIPQLTLHEVEEGDRLQFGTLKVTALRALHGSLPILGYRIGDVAYLTDMTELMPSSRPLLEGIKMLIVGALRHTPHKTHQTVEQAIAFSRSLGNVPTYFIHMCHQVGLHAVQEELLPEGFHYAYDGLELEC